LAPVIEWVSIFVTSDFPNLTKWFNWFVKTLCFNLKQISANWKININRIICVIDITLKLLTNSFRSKAFFNRKSEKFQKKDEKRNSMIIHCSPLHSTWLNRFSVKDESAFFIDYVSAQKRLKNVDHGKFGKMFKFVTNLYPSIKYWKL